MSRCAARTLNHLERLHDELFAGSWDIDLDQENY